MRLPEPLFVIINPLMRMLLRSPLHFLVSSSLMLITFTGRKSGRRITIPVRYVRENDIIRCFTSAANQWWRNMRGGARVSLHIEGREGTFFAEAIHDDAARIRAELLKYLALFPGDATYHEIRLNRDGSLVAEDLDRASRHAVVVEARPLARES